MRTRRYLILGVVALVATAGIIRMRGGDDHSPAARGLPVDASLLAEDTAVWKRLSRRSEAWREASRRFRAEADTRLRDGVLSSADLNRIYASAESYVRQRRRWRALIDCQGDEAWARMDPSAAYSPQERLQSKLVLAAALAEHDDYLLGVHPWFTADKSRKLLKADRPSLEGELDDAVRHFLNPVNRVRLARAVVWHRAVGLSAPDRSPEEIRLDEAIGGSAGYAFFTKNIASRVLEEWKTGGHAAVTFVTDHMENIGAQAAGAVSGVVGNTVGMVATRDGYLKSLTVADKGRIIAKLRPMDVLLEKTPFRLTDKSIPGHYGHVAVWVGSEYDLRELGVWDDPLVRPHHARIRAGGSIVEALRPGVELNSFESFSNIDDFLAIRRPTYTKAEIRAGVLRAFAQLGKAYDFNFDVESDRTIVCSELAFVVYPDIAWPTSPTLGRRSITPDQVAVKGSSEGPFVPVVLWHDGAEVSDRLSESVDLLLKGDYAGFRRLHPGFAGKSSAK